ncbi:MAG: hypothetical protein JXQ27_18950 [Acidobacteria bacterium]|nr:hypothetical protein [Acidobacteriota bacterium]
MPDRAEFLKQVFTKIRQWEQQPPRPAYTEHRVTTTFEGDEAAERLDEKYRVTWYREKPVYVQLEVNGRRRSPEALAEEERRKKETIDKELANPSDKEKITIVAIAPLLDKYAYRIVARETLWDRTAIKIRFDPIPGRFSGGKIADRILEKTAGYIWIDEEEKELMKVEAEITSSVHIGWGILGSINLLRLEYHRRKYDDRHWFLSFLQVRVRVRMLFFTKYNELVESRVTDIAFQ